MKSKVRTVAGYSLMIGSVTCAFVLIRYCLQEQAAFTSYQTEKALEGGSHLVGNVTPLDDCPLIGANRFGIEVVYSSAECGSSLRLYRILSDDRLTTRALMQILDNAHYPNDLKTHALSLVEVGPQGWELEVKKCEWRSWGIVYPLTDRHIDDTMGFILRRPLLTDIHVFRRDGVYQVDAHKAFYYQRRQVDFPPPYLPKIPLCEEW